MTEERRSARAIIRIGAVPDTDLNRVLNGAVDATRRVNKRVVDESARGARERERLERRTADQAVRDAKRAADAKTKESKRAADAAVKEATRAAKEEQRLAAETERYKQRTAEAGARLNIRIHADMARERERSYRGQIRAAERAQREETRAAAAGSESRRRLLVGIGGAALGAGAGAFGLAKQGQSLAGVTSLEQRLEVAGQFRQQLIRTGGEAGITAQERASVEERALRVSEQFNLSLLDVANALTRAQQDFDQFRPVAENLEALGKVAAATGEPLSDLVGTLGNATRAFELDPAGQREFLDALIATSARGSISVGAVSRSLSGQMGVFSQATGRGGNEGAREFLALTQVLGTGGKGANEVETMIDRLTLRLQDVSTQKRLKSIGVNVTQGGVVGAKLTNWQNIASQFAGNEQFQRAEVQQKMFGKGDVIATQAARTLIAAQTRDSELFNRLQFIPMGEGDAQAEKQLADLRNDPSFRLQNIGARAQSATVRDSDRIVNTIAPAVDELTKLQMKFPLLTESFSVLNNTIRGLIATLVADRLLFGRSAGGAAESARAASTALAGAGGLAGKLTVAGAALGAFSVGFLGTKAVLEATGADKALESGGAGLHELINGDVPRQAGRAFDARGASADSLIPGKGDAPGQAFKDAELMKRAIQEGNKRDPVKVVIEMRNGQAVVTRTESGNGADPVVNYGGGIQGFVLP